MTSRTTVAGAPDTNGGFRPGERRLSEGAGHPRNWIGWGRLRLPRLQLYHPAIHCDPAVPVMVNRLRILLYGIGPGFDHFQDEEVELADETGIDHLAFKVGEALGNQGWRHALGWRRRQAESLELVHVPA